MALFHRVTIVGLGLIGGSLGMAIRRKRLAREVVGLSRKSSTLAHAKRRGAIDWGSMAAHVALRDADLLILATPVETIVPQARRLARWMKPGSVLTDVGSTKGEIVRGLERALPRSVAFVGAHPLAGSEQRGLGAADRALFDGSLCVVTATPRTDRQALRAVTALWSSLVRDVIVMTPARHDRLLAATSHLSHLVAFCLAGSTSPEALRVAPRSFLDATRVARSDPDLWDDILLSNRTALLAAMSRFDRHWQMIRRQLTHRDQAALRRFLTRAQSIRQTLAD